MLKLLTIEGFKSFKEETTFDFSKTNYQGLAQTNTIDGILKGILFVGANASGKSNAVQSIKFLLDLLLGNQESSITSFHCFFSENPRTRLQYVFEIDGSTITYSISFNVVKQLIEERLKLNDKIVLTRDGNYAEVFLPNKTTYSDIPDNLLFLRNVYFSTHFGTEPILQKWFEFLKNSAYIDLFSNKIISYKMDKDSLKYEWFFEKNGVDTINEVFEKYHFGQQIDYSNTVEGGRVSINSKDKIVSFKRDNIPEPIPFELESLGNQNLIRLWPAIYHCIENSGMLLMDDFSSGFHNKLEELILRYFYEKSGKSQMVIVTHSTNLLSNRLNRPDQIYSVSLESTGSRIKRFSSESPRESQNVEKMYLSGVFDGIINYED